MSQQVCNAKKRLRFSSSDTDTPKPVTKQPKTRSNMATGEALINKGDATTENDSQVLSLLKALPTGQDQLRTSLTEEMNNMN